MLKLLFELELLGKNILKFRTFKTNNNKRNIFQFKFKFTLSPFLDKLAFIDFLEIQRSILFSRFKKCI